MGKSNSSAPAAPDPYATAAAQASANSAAVRESALMNQIGQNTPYGNLFYSGEIGSPDRAVNTTLAPGYTRSEERCVVAVRADCE